MTNKNIPEIRFPGFTEEWEQRKLGELTDEFKSGYSIKAENIFDKGEYPVYGGNGIRGFTDTFNHDGEFALIGRQGALSGNMNFSTNKAYFTEHAIAVRANNMNDTRFLYFLLCKLQLGRWVTQSAQPGLAVGTLVEIRTQVPGKAKEQQKIGNFFKKLDDTITLHQRELELLKETKKGFLQKMFPKEGEKVPEIRFPGYTEDWEQRKLGEITSSYSGGTPSAEDKQYYGGDIPFIRSGEINEESTELFITTEGLNNSSAKLVSKGDILYALYGATSGEVGISKIDGAINQAILAIKPIKNYHSYLIAQWLKKQKKTIIGSYLQGGQGNLSGSIVKELILTLPIDRAEQQKIGTFFKQLDDTIALQQRELDLLKETKKGFLQKLFV